MHSIRQAIRAVTAGPLVTALTAATMEAAEELATTQPGGRLSTPLLGVVDEAAKVCRWHGHPDLRRESRSTFHQVQRERTLDVANLGALPRGRAVVFASGTPATLIEAVLWMSGPHAAAVRASIAAQDPANRSVALTGTASVPAPLPPRWPRERQFPVGGRLVELLRSARSDRRALARLGASTARRRYRFKCLVD